MTQAVYNERANCESVEGHEFTCALFLRRTFIYHTHGPAYEESAHVYTRL